MKLRVGYEFFHNMQNYVHYPIHFVIMLIFFFHLLLFTIYYFHYMYYCLIVYMLIFLQNPRRIILSIVYMYMFTAFIFHPCSFILSCASFTICLIGYLPKIVLYRQLFSGNALHASLIFQLC